VGRLDGCTRQSMHAVWSNIVRYAFAWDTHPQRFDLHLRAGCEQLRDQLVGGGVVGPAGACDHRVDEGGLR
jgi:hypothetical protein